MEVGKYQNQEVGSLVEADGVARTGVEGFREVQQDAAHLGVQEGLLVVAQVPEVIQLEQALVASRMEVCPEGVHQEQEFE